MADPTFRTVQPARRDLGSRGLSIPDGCDREVDIPGEAGLGPHGHSQPTHESPVDPLSLTESGNTANSPLDAGHLVGDGLRTRGGITMLSTGASVQPFFDPLGDLLVALEGVAPAAGEGSAASDRSQPDGGDLPLRVN